MPTIVRRFGGPRLRAVLVAFAVCLSAAASVGARKPGDRVLRVTIDGRTLTVEACTDRIVRVSFAPDPSFAGHATLAAAPKHCGGASWAEQTAGGVTTVSTRALKVRVDRTTGRVRFADLTGHEILSELDRSLEPASIQGDQTFHVRQQWSPQDEALFGLGQHQLGLTNIKGYDLDLWQHNATVSLPFLVSSRGYGILWDNTSYSRFGDLRQPAFMPPDQLLDASGQPGGLTGTYYAGAHFDRLVATRVDPRVDVEVPGGTSEANRRIHPDLPADGDISVRWEGAVRATETGDHIFTAYSNSGIKLWIDDRLVVDRWRQGWLPWYDAARTRFEAGRTYRVKLEWSKDQGIETMRLQWKTPAPSAATSLWSEVGDGVDYYFVYGPDLDDVVGGYREVTGQAPMMPRWAFGFWQCRERYKTAQESLDVVREFRRRQIPLDAIVQDWQYWPLDAWGSHAFDAARFPDPDGWIKSIHDEHAKLMISVWGKYYPTTENAKAMRAKGQLWEQPLKEGLKDWLGFPYTFYDAFNVDAGKAFWTQVDTALFKRGVDAWWMDATEPDIAQPMPTLERQRELMQPTALGSASRVLNAYSLVNAQAIYEGQRTTAPDQRVFILTRSAFAGQQRYASAIWSGDITSSWGAFKAQIPAGLGFSLSGVPYWTTDIGGFDTPPKFATDKQTPEAAEEWRELNTRWFEFGTFCPLTRAHGQFPFREPWNIAPDDHPAYAAITKFIRLRYRLLPYVYSLAGQITQHHGTMLRPLVMDFRSDAKTYEIGDAFMFGPALLVSPVTDYKARTRAVYLPTGTWYDFWSGAAVAGGRTVDAAAPYDSIPVHVRAGAILPVGPDLQYTNEKPADPLAVYVYGGANGRFTLYEDDGASFAYEKGSASEISFNWNDTMRTLTIGARQGSFTGMPSSRTFNVIVVDATHPAGAGAPAAAGRSTAYDGHAVTIRFQP